MTFGEVVGNENAVEILKGHLAKKNPNRAILIYGPAGCGKTTLARIIAREVQGVDTATFFENAVDYHEMNTSDFRGIDMVRDIRKASQYQTMSKARVWFLDEAHKLSADAQEAILKQLEHPPIDTWFIFATTEPERLKITLRRRCLSVDVQPVDEDSIKTLIKTVLKKEGLSKLSPKVLSRIANESMGSPGVALAIVDKIISLPKEKQLAAVRRIAEEQNTVIELCRALMKNAPWKTISAILKKIEDKDPETIRRQVLEYFRKVMMSGDESAYIVMDCFKNAFYDSGKAGLVMACYEASMVGQ